MTATKRDRYNDDGRTEIIEKLLLLLASIVRAHHTELWLRFLLRQTALERSAPVVCRSFTTSERSTPRSLTPDGTARTARIFIEGYSWTA